MKKPPGVSLILVAVALSALLLFVVRQTRPSAPPAPPDLTGLPDSSSLADAVVPLPPASLSAWPPAPQQWDQVLSPLLSDFHSWTQRYLAADPSEKPTLEAEGVALATARRPQFKKLIIEDPRAAVAAAVPMVVRQELPPSVVALLERRVHTRADVEVQAVSAGSGPDEPVARWFTRFGDEELRTYVYGRRTGQNSLTDVPVNGVAVDGVLALAESPLRVLELGERPPPGTATVETCPVSGISTEVENTEAPIEEETPAVQVGETIVYLCDGGHIRLYEGELVAAEGGTGGAVGFSGPAASSFSNGPRKLLYMRVIFEDSLQEPQTEALAWEAIRQLNSYFGEVSFGKIFYLADVPPLIMLPRSRAWYTADYDTTGSNSPIMNDAKEAARAMGYNPDNYQHYTVIYTGGGGPGSFGGLGSVGGPNVWLRTASVGVLAHEIGHNVGLWHGNSWDVNRPASGSWNTSMSQDVIGGGRNGEYGHSYDVLGSSGSFAGNKGHFMAHHKNLMNWMPTETVATASTSGVYRVFQMDQPVLDSAQRYALRIPKDAGRDYWVEFRQKYNGDHRWFRDGVLLHWGRWGQNTDVATVGSNRGGQLLDTTPGSADGKNDAPIVIGRTFSDLESGIHITPLAKAGTVPESMDVQVHLGDFPTNQAPIIHSLTASTTTPAVNGNVNFAVDATDPDGDPLAFFWDFGDANYGTNTATASRVFNTARHHAVRCIVSDMKGGETSKLLLITVGSPTTRIASGRVLDAAGQPVPEVRIQNGSTGTSFRGAWTDSNGDFVVTQLATGSASVLTPIRAGFAFSPANFSLAIGSSVAGVDFTAGEAVRLSIEAVDAEAAETGGNPGLFRLTRTGDTSADLTVLADLQGDAALTSDYTLAPSPNTTTFSPIESFTIPAGSSSLDIVLTASNDSTREGPEAARIVLMPSNLYSIFGKAAADVVILDTGSNSVPNRVSVIALDADASEAGDPAIFEVRRTGNLDSALTVSYTLDAAPNTAAAINGEDFQTLPTSVIIPAGEAAAQIIVNPLQDSLAEGQETLRLNLSSSTSYGVGTPNNAIIRIADDDIPVVTLIATDPTAAEAGNDPGLFTLSRTGDPSASLKVAYIIGGTALHGTDYLPLPGEVTFEAGQATTTIPIFPIDDDHGEPAQTVVLQLRNDPRYTLAAPPLATVTIADNDLPVVAVGVQDGICSEPSDTGSFRITTTGSGAGNITVRYTVSGTATPGADYTPLSGSMVMSRNATATITVTPLNDTLLEDAESVVLTLLPDPAYQVDVLQPESTLVIRDDDHSNTVNVSFSSLSMAENGNSRLFLSRTSRTGAAITSGDLTVQYALSGTATADVDFTGLTGTAVIPNGQSSLSITVTGIDDALAEGTETLVVDLLPGSYSRERSSATLLITDNESSGFTRTASFANRRTVKSEGDAAFTIPVVLSSADPTNEVRVDYIIDTNSATGSGVDVNLRAGTLVFPPGTTVVEIPVTIVDDLLPEPEEHLTLRLTHAHGAQLTPNGNYHTLFIRDNEPRLTLRSSSPVAFESTAAPGAFTLVRTGSLSAALTVALTWGGTATAGVDYLALPPTATFSAGQRELELAVTPISDAVVEGPETVTASLSPSGAYFIQGDPSATVTVLDSGSNHPPSVRITQPRRSAVALPQGSGLHLAAAVTDDAAPGSTTVLWTRSSGPGSVTFSHPTSLQSSVTFSSAGTHTLRCTATDSSGLQASAEVVILVAAGASPWSAQDIGIGGTNASGSADFRTGWTQNQGAGSSITSTSDSFHYQHTALTGDGEIIARYEGTDGLFSSARTGLMLRDGTAANARHVALTFQGTNGSLAWTRRTSAGGSVSSTSVSLPPGPRWLKLQRAGNVFSAWQSIDGVNWTAVGTAQTLTLPTALRAGIATTSGNATRPARGLFSGVNCSGTPDHTAPFALAGPTATLDATAICTLSGSSPQDNPADLDWSAVSGPGTVTFADPTSATTTAAFSAEGSYTLRLSADDGEAASFDDLTVNVTFATLGFASVTDAQEQSSQPGSVTITRDGVLDMPLTVHYNTSGEAAAPTDFSPLPGSLTLPAGAASAVIEIHPTLDDIAEGDKSLTLNLLPDPTYHLPLSASASLQIKDLPLDAWRFDQFGPAANDPTLANLLADPDNDGLNNLLEYALNLSATNADPSPLTQELTTLGPDTFLRLTVPKNPNAAGISYTVQATSDLSDPDSWSSAGLIIEEDTPTTLRVRDSVPASPGIQRFLRATATLAPTP
jgi:hypothetical protein